MRYQPNATLPYQHAAVIGAGLDGLLVARVLTEYFQRVTVITPHTLLPQPAPPSSINETIPLHLFSIRGHRDLEHLFPGFAAELMSAGAPTLEWTADVPARLPAGWGPRFHSDLITRSATTNLLAHVIRQRLLDYGRNRVEFLQQPVTGLEHGAVKLKDGLLSADLVVDAIRR